MTTETPAAPDAGAAAAVAAEPLIWFQGQPYSRESAAARRNELMADASYREAAANGDATRQQELAALFQISRFGSAPTPPPENFDQVRAEMDTRAGRERAAYAEGLRQSGAYTDEQIHEIINQRPIPLEQKRYHEQELAALKKDREFVARYLRGDRDAVREMKRHIAGSSLPVGTLDQINAWKEAHPFRGAA